MFCHSLYADCLLIQKFGEIVVTVVDDGGMVDRIPKNTYLATYKIVHNGRKNTVGMY